MTIETKVQKVIAEKITGVDIADVVPDASLIEDLGADSLTIAELIMTMEDIFDIEIDDDEVGSLITVQNIIDFINSKA